MLSAILRALHAALGAALARVILRRMRTDGVPITPDQQAQMARRLHREVVAARRQSYRRTVSEIRRFDRSLTPAPIQPYPIEAVQAAIERAVAPPPPRRRPSRPAPLLDEEVRPSGETSTEPDPRVRASGPEPPAPPSGGSPRATVAAPEGTPRRAAVDAPEVERPRSGVVTTADIDPVTRTRVRASVSAPTLENRDDPRVIARVSESLTATLTRHVAAASRAAIEQTADAAGEEIGWARVLSGTENCPWCAMLASRGPVYKSDKSAGYVVGQGRDSAGPRRGRGGRRRQGDGTRGNQVLGQPYHDNCVVPGVWISGPDTEVGYRRHYEGELVTLVTAAGHKLSITPQHPVLTDRGWVPAGLLNVGDKLVSACRSDRNVVSGPDVDHAPARIEDVVGALGVMGPTTRRCVPGAAEQFHGDGFDAEVDVVSGNHLLWNEIDGALLEPSAELDLHRAAAQNAFGGLSLSSFGGLLEFGDISDAPARGGVRRSGLTTALCRAHALGADLPSFTSAAQGDTSFGEPSIDYASRNAALLGEGEYGLSFGITTGYIRGRRHGLWAPVGVTRKFDPPTLYGVPEAGRIFAEYGADLRVRLSGSVHLDDLVDKRVGVYHGPVLNVATREGWYSANSIVVSNCDCEVVLVRRGQPWEGQTEHEWLDSLWTLTSNAAEATGDSLEQIWSRAYRRIQKEPDLYDELMDLWETSTAGLSGSAALRAYRAAVKENTPAALAAARRPRRATSDE
ncbi:hypothetical protein IU469_22225 [Nocardia puris]|nr:Hint domain-containing protein [Nocardia puris]MBF6368417.1 hypothetical protein [Nocardia puris]